MVQKAQHSLLLDELSTVQIRDLLASGWDTVIVPLGATEQHGPALPLLVDNEHGVQTALRAARILGKTLVGPVVTLGYSPEHSKFPGTISLAKSTLAGMLHDIAESHARSGFRLVYFWIAHGGNNAVLQEVLPSLEAEMAGLLCDRLERSRSVCRQHLGPCTRGEGHPAFCFRFARRRIRNFDDAGDSPGSGAHGSG